MVLRDDGSVPRRLVLCVVGLVVGLASWSIALDTPAYSFAQRSWVGVLALVGAGWSLVAAAAISSRRRTAGAVPLLLFATGVAWFLGEWDSPTVGSSLVFTIGLVVAALGPALITWVMLGYPSGRLAALADRIIVVLCFAAAVIGVGILPALYFDPDAAGCMSCPDNLIAIADNPARAADVGRAGLWFAAVAALAPVGVAAWRLARSSPTRRRLVAPIIGPCAAFLALAAWSYLTNADRGFIASGDADRRRWLAEAAMLATLALAVVWNAWRARRMRATVARITVRLDRAAGGGSLRDAIARILGDADLDLAYALVDGTHVTADGQPVELRPTGIRTVTALVCDGRTVASLVHRRGLLDNPVLVDEVVAAAGLALENERLHAELRAQERALRASRARIVEAGDAERQRLERNLHDGSQQRLIGLLFGARYAQSLLGRGSSPTTRASVDGLAIALIAAVDELRRIAHGIYPAVLSDEGLAAAIDSLADDDEALVIGSIPDERFGPAVENAAYRVVAEVARSGPARVCAARRDGVLVLDVESDRVPDGLVDLEDRVGAVEGVLRASEAPSGGVTIRVELPCV